MDKQDLNILFICHSGQIRSITARDLFKDRYNTKGIGLYPYPNYNELNPKLEKLLVWSDKIFVMEKYQLKLIEKYYPKYIKKVECLYIKDWYYRNEPYLINLLKEKLKVLTS
jgi:predicted protein tyrosine phosphatase